MIEVPVVSVLGEGLIERVRLWLEEDACGPTVKIVSASESPDLVAQLNLARQIASFFFTRAYVRPLAASTLEHGRLVAEFEGRERYEGGSFGLAFLAGCLALGLQVPIQKGRLFSASIAEQVAGQGLAGGGCLLAPVARAGEKLAAACMGRQERLYLYSEDEKSTLEFEQAFWRGDADRGCLPCTLPAVLPTAAVAAIALDTELLLGRLRGHDHEAPFLLLLLSAVAQTGDDAGFPHGVGRSIARCRGQNRLEGLPAMERLGEDLGVGRGTASAEMLLAYLVPEALRKCSTEEARADLLKAAISASPDLRLFPPGPEPDMPIQTDLELWLARESASGPARLLLVLDVLRVLNDLTPDMSPYWPGAKQVVVRGLGELLGQVTEEAASGREQDAARLMRFLNQQGLADKICHLQSRWISEAQGLADQCLRSLEAENRRLAARECAVFCANLRAHDLTKMLQPLLDNKPEDLTLTFQVAGDRGEPGAAAGAGRQLERLNDLEVVITGPGELKLVVQSPVLLMDSCFFHYSTNSFCRRSAMVLADDTLSRFPLNDTRSAWTLFGQSLRPTRICFKVRPDGPPASIRWPSTVVHWPPAIDSQMLVASLAQDIRDVSHRRLLDASCGTGYLAITAAHRWLTLEELHLLDIDPLAVIAAQSNARADVLAGRLDIHGYATDFRRFRGNGFDVLLCAPPYLPHRPVPSAQIELSTNGTILLEEVAETGHMLAKEIWLVFSAMAWPEFQRALARVPHGYASIGVLRRDFVPFRLPWLDPVPPEDDGNQAVFEERLRYYRRVLMPRGLIDMDDHASWPAYARQYPTSLPENVTAKVVSDFTPDLLEQKLDTIEANSRGYRFWHEVRVVRLTTRG